MTRDDYLGQLAALLPPGAALPRDPDAALMRLLRVPAGELAAVEARALALLAEADPREAAELLADWERVAGLPDPCLGPAPALAQRRARLVQQITRTRGQSRAFFTGLAAALGFPGASVAEFRPFRIGTDAVGSPIADEAWAHAWRLDAPAGGGLTSFAIGRSAVGEPLRAWGSEVLECVVRALAPAQSVVLFGYAPPVLSAGMLRAPAVLTRPQPGGGLSTVPVPA